MSTIFSKICEQENNFSMISNKSWLSCHGVNLFYNIAREIKIGTRVLRRMNREVSQQKITVSDRIMYV